MCKVNVGYNRVLNGCELSYHTVLVAVCFVVWYASSNASRAGHWCRTVWSRSRVDVSSANSINVSRGCHCSQQCRSSCISQSKRQHVGVTTGAAPCRYRQGSGRTVRSRSGAGSLDQVVGPALILLRLGVLRSLGVQKSQRQSFHCGREHRCLHLALLDVDSCREYNNSGRTSESVEVPRRAHGDLQPNTTAPPSQPETAPSAPLVACLDGDSPLGSC